MEKHTPCAPLHLITGGSGSGKSAYAESCVLKTALSASNHEIRQIYIATMIPYGEEGRQRVERHRRLRAEKNFETVECYTGLERLRIDDYDSSCSIVLLECMSNLVANEMFEQDGAGNDTVRAILRGVDALRQQAGHLFIVTNEVFSDGITYDAETMRYMSYLGEVNRALAEEADTVTEVVYGIPLSVRI
ncbi:MAG: bifunctional adenosylcobinamide kinase/adenosylcobinamide-phosphate guanylyltransferase [Lachnospiraceae bacterium]|nr:bifunctional adenosylcobinamide kinase/adenosylcobinamide-phosphate guanylyltransferase [Lachnospiraceae bacterium]